MRLMSINTFQVLHIIKVGHQSQDTIESLDEANYNCTKTCVMLISFYKMIILNVLKVI